MIERCQVAYEDRWTLGYSFMREGLRKLNKHRRDLSDEYDDLEVGLRKGDEMGVFLEAYMGRLCDLDRSIAGRDPHDVAGEIYQDEWERYAGRAKLDEVATLNSFPTYFMIDRDIVHPAAFDRAAQLGHPLDPQTADDAIHDLWDETRFKPSLSMRTEELVELLIAMGAPGIRAFLMASAFRYSATGSLSSEGPLLDLNRHGIVDLFRSRIQSYSGSGLSEVPGSVGYDLRRLQDFSTLPPGALPICPTCASCHARRCRSRPTRSGRP